jgi:CheY-like chemotaxis protein
VKKFFNKPVRIDGLLKSISEILNVKLDLDDTPCMIEAHFNEDILFIEVAQGLNKEKIELLRYKITELLSLYQVGQPKVLLMLVGLEVTPEDSLKLGSILDIIREYSGARPRHIKVLTNSDYVSQFVNGRSDLAGIEVTDNLEDAMEGLLGRKTGSYLQGGGKAAQQEFLTATTSERDEGESIQLRFEGENKAQYDISELRGGARIAVVDDDMVIQELIKTAFSDTGLEVKVYNNGKEFVEDPEAGHVDLVFLDLLMPEMDGFQVLEALQRQQNDVPIIVLTALSKRDSVVKAVQYGVKSYLIKPLQPEAVRKKAAEVLRVNF